MTATLTIEFVLPERVHLRLANPDAYTITRIMRADANGTRSVRTLTGLLPSAAAVIDVDDFEYALAGTQVVYTAYRDTGAVAATATMTTGQAPHVVILAAPLYPGDGVVLADGTLDASAVTFAVRWDGHRNCRPGP